MRLDDKTSVELYEWAEKTCGAKELRAEIERLTIENRRLRDILAWSEQNCPDKCAGVIRRALEQQSKRAQQ